MDERAVGNPRRFDPDMNDRGVLQALQRAVQHLDAVAEVAFGFGRHPFFIQLEDVDAGSGHVLPLFVQSSGETDGQLTDYAQGQLRARGR